MTCVRRFFTDNYERLLEIANRYVGPDEGGDLLNDLCIRYLESKKVEEICARGELMQYTVRALQICSFSTTTPFFYKYRSYRSRIAHGYPLHLLTETAQIEEKNHEQIENQITEVFCILQEIRWLDAEIFKAYHLHNHSIRTLSDATGISKGTIYKAIKTAQTHLKENESRIRGHGREGDQGHGD